MPTDDASQPAPSPVSPETLAWLVEQGRIWSRTEREKHRQRTEPLPASVRERLAPFFEPEILERARYRWVPTIEHPPFRDEALSRGVPDRLDYTQSAGLTHNDTILMNRERVRGADPPVLLFFHELVHVVQYDILDVDEFVRQYVTGYVAGGDYYAVPLELVAYALQAVADQGVRFSVKDLVRRTLGLRLA